MTDPTPQGQASTKPAEGNLGRFVGVLEITEPTGEKRLVSFEAPAGAAELRFGAPATVPRSGAPMAVVHSTAARNAIVTAVAALLNAGSANAAGIARFRTAANAVVAALPLTNPAVGAPSSGVGTFAAITSDTNAAGGTIASLTLEDRDRATVLTINDIRTTVGGDMQGNSLTVSAGATVAIQSLQYIAPQ
jgi:hypothetical protein